MSLKRVESVLVDDLSGRIGPSELIDLTTNEAGRAVALVADGPSDWRDGGFAQSSSEAPRALRILGPGYEVRMPDEVWNPHFVRELPDERWLLVCARCSRFPDGRVESNARIVGRNGRTLSEMTLGDGIQDIRPLGGDSVLVTYFDEGIFGNYGWDEPLGSCGAVIFSLSGAKQWELPPAAADMYAMNAVSPREFWLSWYTDFPVCRVRLGEPPAEWDVGQACRALAVWKDRVWLVGAYSPSDHLYEVNLDEVPGARLGRTLQFALPGGATAEKARVWGVGPRLYAASGGQLSVLDVRGL